MRTLKYTFCVELVNYNIFLVTNCEFDYRKKNAYIIYFDFLLWYLIIIIQKTFKYGYRYSM